MNTQTVYIGIDDTDAPDYHIGTGRLTRDLAAEFAAKYSFIEHYSVLRHQLFLDERIPYTSHNSPAIITMDLPADKTVNLENLADFFASGIKRIASPEASPGLCMIKAEDCDDNIQNFGIRAAHKVLEKTEAINTARGNCILLELGGTGRGIIGALAATGLTAQGSCGRYLEVDGKLRGYDSPISVTALRQLGLDVVLVDKKASPIHPGAMVMLENWPRPRRIGGRPVLFVEEGSIGMVPFDKKGKKENDEPGHD
ncbi:MAG: hypothetical protein HQK83_01255 [Fibrobacteria bacterium]|nr:hypothetical protein [Fibrobacteria bacterium]